MDIYGNRKKFLVEEGHFRCKRCSAIVRIDKNGFAACETCGMVYNESPIRGTEYHRSKSQKKKDLEKFKASVTYQKKRATDRREPER